MTAFKLEPIESEGCFKGFRVTLNGVPVSFWVIRDDRCTWGYKISDEVKVSSKTFADLEECKLSFEKQLNSWNWKEAVLYWKNKQPEPFKDCGDGI